MAEKQIIIQKSGSNGKVVPNFIKSDFDNAIEKKGYNVIHEKALKCPCKSENTNQQSNCKNCGGTGWIFINSTQTKMILHSMNRETKFKDWSEQNLGTVAVSSMIRDQLSYMDRITVVDGRTFFSEVLHLKVISDDDQRLFAFTTYNIKSVFYAGLFISVDQQLTRLIENTDFTFVKNQFFLDESFYDENNDDISITIRYEHAPQYHVLDLSRETMQSIVAEPGGNKETVVDLPISAVARRAHYILDNENIAYTRLVDNSFIDECNDTLK